MDYPTTDMIEQMDAEEVAYHLRLLELCRQRLQMRADRLGAKGLWLVAIKSRDVQANAKINVIKIIREITGLGLKEAKAMCDLVEGGSPQLISEAIVKGTNPNVEALEQFAIIGWR